MPRRSDRVPCYYFASKSTGKRVSWCFPTRKAAIKWRDNECYSYLACGSLEEYLAYKNNGGNKAWVINAWQKAKERYFDYEMKRGVFLTHPRRTYSYENDGVWEYGRVRKSKGRKYE